MAMSRSATAAVSLVGVAGAAAMVRRRERKVNAIHTASTAPDFRPKHTTVPAAFSLRSAARCVPAKYKPPREPSERVPRNCGEDAFFLASPTVSTATVGIADGVGGWSADGVDPALFAWDLMRECKDLAEGCGAAGSSVETDVGDDSSTAAVAGGLCPKSLLIKGFDRLLHADGGGPEGSSTACVASLDRLSGDLRVANLGDSGALLVRAKNGVGHGDCVLESTPQMHNFNCPFQLCCHEDEGDTPACADVYVARAEPGDILVLATDGFLDNVSRSMATRMAAAMCDQEPGTIAECLLALAQRQSVSLEDTPFALDARQHGYQHTGGKPDDITVVVARVEIA